MSARTAGSMRRLLAPVLLLGLVMGQAAPADDAGRGDNATGPVTVERESRDRVVDSHDTIVDSRDTIVEVLYATDRALGDAGSPDHYYGDLRGRLRYGRCAVRYSPIGVLAGLSELAPFYVPDETTRVERVTEFDADTFWRLAVDERTTGERVVFTTHGYNMSFPRACRHAARLQRALGTDARVVLFSWPSDGGLLSYARDETDAAWSVTQMERVLGGLSERIGPGRLQVLAHSLGTRSVTRALENLDCRRPGPALVDQVVFVGPDIDTDMFLAGLPALRRVAQRITVYASSNDTPLKVSRQVHGYPRLGEAGAYLAVVPGVETIDVSAVPVFEVTGHLYHLYNPHAVADVVRLLRTGHAAAQRPGLRPRRRGTLTYWEIVPDA